MGRDPRFEAARRRAFRSYRGAASEVRSLGGTADRPWTTVLEDMETLPLSPPRGAKGTLAPGEGDEKDAVGAYSSPTFGERHAIQDRCHPRGTPRAANTKRTGNRRVALSDRLLSSQLTQ